MSEYPILSIEVEVDPDYEPERVLGRIMDLCFTDPAVVSFEGTAPKACPASEGKEEKAES